MNETESYICRRRIDTLYAEIPRNFQRILYFKIIFTIQRAPKKVTYWPSVFFFLLIFCYFCWFTAGQLALWRSRTKHSDVIQLFSHSFWLTKYFRNLSSLIQSVQAQSTLRYDLENVISIRIQQKNHGRRRQGFPDLNWTCGAC